MDQPTSNGKIAHPANGRPVDPAALPKFDFSYLSETQAKVLTAIRQPNVAPSVLVSLATCLASLIRLKREIRGQSPRAPSPGAGQHPGKPGRPKSGLLTPPPSKTSQPSPSPSESE